MDSPQGDEGGWENGPEDSQGEYEAGYDDQEYDDGQQYDEEPQEDPSPSKKVDGYEYEYADDEEVKADEDGGYGGNNAVFSGLGLEGDYSHLLEEEEGNPEEEIEALEELPIFANDRNRDLHAQIKEKEALLDKASRGVKETTDRVHIMQEHLKNVKAEIEHTQGLVDAKGKEIETEDHLKQLSDREIGRIRQELKKLDIEAEDVQDQMNIVQNSIHKGTEKLEQFKLAMNFNQEDLEQWALAARQKEEDNIALMKYTKADEGRIKELTLSIEKITGEVQNLKSAVEQEVTEAAAKQIELERTAEEFRTLHKERQDLLRQWRETTEAIDRRRHEITEVAKGYAEVEARIEAKKAELKMQAKRLKQQEQENKEFEGKIALRQRVVQKMRAEYTMAQSRLQEFQDEVEVLRNELQKAASDMANLKAANNNINADLEHRRAMLEDARARYQATKRRLESAAKESDKMEAVAQEREKELLTEESRLKEMDKELRNKKEALFRENQAKFKLKQEEKTLDAELSGARSSLKNLNAKIHHLDQESLRQQELIYNADFQIQQMERKVARASGERSDEEKKALQARIAELQENLDGITAQVNMLQSQCKRLQEDLRATKRHKDQLEKELEGHRHRTHEINLLNSSSEQSLKALLKQKEELMVEHDVLKLELKKLRNALSVRADEVFSLENRSEQLKMSMEERQKEISVHQEVQRAQLKLAEEERHKIAMDLKDRLQAIDKLKAKYDVLAGRMRGSSEDGEERSQAYFIIQAAQKREELQREGDELDAAIRQTEREIKALVNTLKHLNSRNTEYRSSFQKADMASREASKLKQLEQAQKSAKDTLFRRKRELQRFNADIDAERERILQLEQEKSNMQAHLDNLYRAQQQVVDEYQAQLNSLEKMEKRLGQMVAAHKKKLGLDPDADEVTLDEISFKAQSIRDSNNNVLFTLGQLAKEFPELNPDLSELVQNFSLKIPARPPSRAPTASVQAVAGSTPTGGRNFLGTPRSQASAGSPVGVARVGTPVSARSVGSVGSRVSIGSDGSLGNNSVRSSGSRKKAGSVSSRGSLKSPIMGGGFNASRPGSSMSQRSASSQKSSGSQGSQVKMKQMDLGL